MKKYLLSVFLILPVSCVSQIDESIYKVDQDMQTAWKATKVALDNGATSATQTEQSRTDLQKEKVEIRVGAGLAKVTGPDGRVAAKDVLIIMHDRDELMLRVAVDHANNTRSIDLWKEAVVRYDVAVETISDKKADWLKKRKSAAAAVNAALQALSASGITAAVFAAF